MIKRWYYFMPENSRSWLIICYKRPMILGAVLQRSCKRTWLYYRHTISLGEINSIFQWELILKAYFLDWFASYADSTTRRWKSNFSYQENGHSYNFEFEDCAPHLYKAVSWGITHNHVLGQMLVNMLIRIFESLQV